MQVFNNQSFKDSTQAKDNRFSDFALYGYQVLETLNHNLNAGRNTYKAIEITTQKLVIIKQFRFATTDNWDAYKQIEREIQVLQGLNHPNIPRYLNTFDSGDGICLVQEYINAPNLSVSSSFSPEEIKEIALQVLEILIYLQNRVPTIIHRDLKLENILFDENQKVYLVDFGFARIGGSEVTALSSMVMGTAGFLPPEQIFGQPLTKASDLYGLGATLICLLTGLKSSQLSNLVNYDFRINYKSLVTKYSLRFIDWLDQIVNPDVTQRFKNAEVALKALRPLDIIRVPEIKLDKAELDFFANQVDEKLSQFITINNGIPNTILECKWSVAPHPNDPPHTPDEHSWIHFSPKELRGNNVKCEVIVDTSKLKVDSNYERKLILDSNSTQDKCYLKLKLKTAPIKNNVAIPPYLLTAQVFLVLAIVSGILTHGWLWLSLLPEFTWTTKILLSYFGSILGLAGLIIHVEQHNNIKESFKMIFRTIGVISYSLIGGLIMLFIAHKSNFDTALIIGSVAGMMIINFMAFIGAFISYQIAEISTQTLESSFCKKGYSKRDALIFLLITLISGVLTGIGTVIGINLYLLATLAATGLPLTAMLIYPQIKQAKIKAQYRRQESKNLINP